VQLDQV
jgi:lipid II:glycine glycyltransferase (peptidoglycan interpeptide bridge formation enzyme)